MAKAVDTIRTFLKKNGVETDAIADAIAREFDGREIVSAEKVIGDDMIAVKKSEFDAVKSDMMDWKRKFRESEKSNDDLKTQLDSATAGDDRWKKAHEKLKTEFDRMKPLAERLMAQQRDAWKSISAKIPENIKPRFRFPDDGAELGDDDILRNMDKVAEYSAIGALKLGGEPPFTPGAPRGTPGGKPPVDMSPEFHSKSASQKLEMAFDQNAKSTPLAK